MGESTASWKRLLEASWNKAKQQATLAAAREAAAPEAESHSFAQPAAEEAAVAARADTQPAATEATPPAAPAAGGLGSLLSRVLRRSSSSNAAALPEERGKEPPTAAPLEPEETLEAGGGACQEAPDPAATIEIEDDEQEVELEEVEPEQEAEPQAEAPAPAPAAAALAARAVALAAAAAPPAAAAAAPASAGPLAPGLLRGGPKPKWGQAPAKAPGVEAQERRQYVVSNALLKASTQGLAFRRSKRMQDADPGSLANWGSIVVGADGKDGWLAVARPAGERYLPFMFNGVRVLVPKDQYASGAKASAASPSTASAGGSPATGTYSGQRLFQPKSPAVAQLQQKAATPQQLALKRQPSFGWVTPDAKRAATGPPEVPTEYDLQQVVVSFGSVGADFASQVLGKNAARGDKVFDWEGVRRCVRHLRCERGLRVIGVVLEHWWGADRGRGSVGIPMDVKAMCVTILETPRLTGEKHKVAEKEMAIKCAWRRNCRFIESEELDWRSEMGDEKCRAWLEANQDLLQMRYFFEGQFGIFRTLQ